MTDAAEVKDGLFALWRDAAEKNVRDGIDWPSIVRRLFRTLDEAAAREAAAEARGAQAVLGIRFRVETACDGYANLTDADVPDDVIDLAAYQQGARDAAEAIRAAAAAAGGGV